jgi:hypothetical protein
MKEFCHVCGKEKKPYIIVMNSDSLSIAEYLVARESGPICERCNKYYGLTGEFHDASESEFENAEKASWFAQMLLLWKDKKLIPESETDFENLRDFPGTSDAAKWLREKLNKEK